ncbi:YtxH domain-containing protein [Streptococcus loxodontisalivarius]|uniref:Gas vesicle protein n=1 Tax=Streptococcus loxodontisalivarius TaxID=1349415 RepID=A0ABS2PU59_9STRE|nr:YtxH domain-containing protein [Streptococcus loxodontisalivarius]MBM7643009.1 gas vesicle protein [Streptococcus loxodontisalivarius]
MNKFLKTLVVGASAGAATAYFFTSKKGKEVKVKATKLYNDYKQDPESYHQMAKDKVNEYKDVAVETFNDYKEKYETADIKKEDIIAVVKEKSEQVKDLATEKFQSVKESVDTQAEETNTQVDDIVIDLVEEVPVETAESTERTKTEEN